ncbi:hypothetical protein ACFYNY_27840 [Streptomyces sp. NPDC006530]|uniref:hypothetical protein n=1 Tax=Streptomyces sp. NPDC006530 TaxID=3364750 RepID=UPI0036CF2C53
MADERHEWLDRDAAERLLRGEGIEPGDERARAEAARLSALLSSLAPAEQATAELPGEEAALAAFRKARPDNAPGDRGALGVVRVGRVTPSRPAPRRRRFAPVRLGLAAALACCALGGVAVAAGTGVLPGPFAFDEQDPTPASTVSAEATPGPTADSASPSQPAASPTPDRQGPSSGAPTSGDPSHSARPGASATGGSADPGDKDGTGPGSDEGQGGQWLARTADDCRAYRSGKLDTDKRRNLESAAHGAGAVKAFCDLLLDGKAGDGGGNGDSGGGGGQGSGGDKGRGKGDGSGNKNGGAGGGKHSSLAPHPSKLLDLLTAGALGPAAAH